MTFDTADYLSRMTEMLEKWDKPVQSSYKQFIQEVESGTIEDYILSGGETKYTPKQPAVKFRRWGGIPVARPLREGDLPDTVYSAWDASPIHGDEEAVGPYDPLAQPVYPDGTQAQPAFNGRTLTLRNNIAECTENGDYYVDNDGNWQVLIDGRMEALHNVAELDEAYLELQARPVPGPDIDNPDTYMFMGRRDFFQWVRSQPRDRRTHAIRTWRTINDRERMPE